MMIVQEVGERLLTNVESCVASHQLASGFWHRQTEARDLRKSPILNRTDIAHAAFHYGGVRRRARNVFAHGTRSPLATSFGVARDSGTTRQLYCGIGKPLQLLASNPRDRFSDPESGRSIGLY